MAGARRLRNEIRVLGALESGPKRRAELLQVLGWDPLGRPSGAFDGLLAKMREAGLVRCVSKGVWALAEGCEVCPSCHGRGLVEKAG